IGWFAEGRGRACCAGKGQAIAFLTVAAGAGTARAADLIPVPDFTEYGVPVSMPPAPDHVLWEWLNVGLLVVALSLASYFALVSRSRRGLFLLAIASLVWFGFIYEGCICAIGATQNVVLALFDANYAIPLTVVLVFVLPLVFTLFFGRTFCAAVCPLGAIQELVAVRPIRVPRWLDHALGLLPYIYLGLAVIYAAMGTAFVVCRYDPFVPIFRLGGDVNMLIFGGALLVMGIFIGRPYCRYLCPYGALLAILSRAAKWHARIPPEQCIQCRLCEDSCPYGAIQEPSAPPPRELRPAARRRLAALLALAPVLVIGGGCLGWLLTIPLARLEHEVRLAERIHDEDAGLVEGMTDASEAFRNTGQAKEELLASVVAIRSRFRLPAILLGGWVGLVVAVKLISLSVRRRREDYQPDRARCVSCARCYWYCPGEQVRLGLIDDVSELVDLKKPEAKSAS
ncbi:MAG: 4Fe-4S binding protein, partial [Pirellulaceae bacterium]|nr:4Fe-4S binding protein [Pirellulaceae bacterium]